MQLTRLVGTVQRIKPDKDKDGRAVLDIQLRFSGQADVPLFEIGGKLAELLREEIVVTLAPQSKQLGLEDLLGGVPPQER